MGDVSFLVSELVGAEGSVVGVDLDGDAVRFADKRRAARAITNVEFREEDARSVHSERLFDAAVGPVHIRRSARILPRDFRAMTPARRAIAGSARVIGAQ